MSLLDIFRTNLRAYIEETEGMTQEKLSKEAGFHRSYVNKILQDESPSILTVEKIAETLEVEAYKLFKPTDDEPA